MTLALSRIDYTTVGVTSRGTTVLFPPHEVKQPQKFAVADHDGVLHVYGIIYIFFFLYENVLFYIKEDSYKIKRQHR